MDPAAALPASRVQSPTGDRRLSLVAGLLFLLTFVSAIAGAQLYVPLLTEPGYVTSAASDNGPLLGVVCELVLIAANIGTALALFPILRERFPALSLGYVAARLVECGFIAVGILAVLTVVALHRSPGSHADSDTAAAFIALHDATFLLGPGFVVGLGNGLLLGWMAYHSGLTPRWLTLFGLIGGPLMSLSGIAVLFGLYGQTSPISAVLTLPEIVWEAGLVEVLTVRGLRGRAAAPVRTRVKRTTIRSR